jgi:thymidylate synthase
MAIVDLKFNELVKDILENGIWQQPEDVRAKWDDGTPAPARSVTDIQWKFDNSEALALTNKLFYDRYSLKELWWIWIMKSNRVQDLRDMNKSGESIWDKWEIKDPNSRWFGTIGPAYGYQLAQPVMNWQSSRVELNHLQNPENVPHFVDDNGMYMGLDQVDHLIQTLLRSAGSRRILTTLWIPSDLDQMSLTPCVWSTQWLRWGGKLNLTVNIRSNDICVGNPFNVFQYQVLQHMICQIVNIPVGTITFNITDAHIYDRHIELAKEQIGEEIHEAPTLRINPEIRNFYDFKISDVELLNKKPAKKIDYEVSI